MEYFKILVLPTSIYIIQITRLREIKISTTVQHRVTDSLILSVRRIKILSGSEYKQVYSFLGISPTAPPRG